MVVGNLIALQQTNIKRLLAYSSIGQVGFMLMAITTISDASASALLLHIVGYLVTNLAVFMAVIAVYNRTGKELISDFRGLAETQPYLAFVITVGLLSLGGMPLLAGFFTKFFLFQAAAEQNFLWLATVAVIMSTVSLYYYLQVIRQMYLYEPEGDTERWHPSIASYAVTFVLFIGIFVIGIWATPDSDAFWKAAAIVVILAVGVSYCFWFLASPPRIRLARRLAWASMGAAASAGLLASAGVIFEIKLLPWWWAVSLLVLLMVAGCLAVPVVNFIERRRG